MSTQPHLYEPDSSACQQLDPNGSGLGPIEPLVDATAAAHFLHLSPRRVVELARRGEIPAYPVGRGGTRHLWRFRISELVHLRWLALMDVASIKTAAG